MSLRLSIPSRKTKLSAGICISVYGRNLPELIEKLELARSYKTLLIELRLDYLRTIGSSDLEEIRGLLHGDEILTFRRADEGGVCKVDRNTHKNILLEIISICRPKLIDVEISTLESFPSLVDSLENSQ